jgi:predicted molibdopterin-dependent oxidoreductase YjgC
MSDAVRLTIEGREVEVPKGTNLLEAAKLAGVLVPHYCYHPSLPVAGVCRMCLVEVEGWPKLAAACATPVVAGMVARVSSPKARQGRQGVLEFLLINHPLDCPICDQAGEAAAGRATRSMPSATRPSRSSAPTCCTSRTAASCARAASGSWTTWRARPC